MNLNYSRRLCYIVRSGRWGILPGPVYDKGLEAHFELATRQLSASVPKLGSGSPLKCHASRVASRLTTPWLPLRSAQQTTGLSNVRHGILWGFRFRPNEGRFLRSLVTENVYAAPSLMSDHYDYNRSMRVSLSLSQRPGALSARESPRSQFCAGSTSTAARIDADLRRSVTRTRI